MIKGVLNDDLETMVVVEISNGNGAFQSVNALLDTGFGGDLTLPSDEVARLGLKYADQTPLILAGDQPMQASVHHGYVKWFGSVRRIDVIAMEGQPLLGMTLLAGCKITIHARPGGEALIEEERET